ncbi:MAG: hypothetical protein KJ686_04445, partial [Actinobacteria bacterium]|nr:hypothetical protein [Actinomycetota bacterium]
RTEESGCNMGNATCVGQFHAKTNLGVTTIGSITAGTDSTTLLGGKGTGGDGVRLEPFAADITTGNITSRGRVQLPYQDLTAAFGITTGTVTAGTNDTSGNGGTGVNIRTYLAAWITTGAIASRGMVNLESVVNLGTITTGGITAGTNDGSLSGGLGVHINCILASITVGGGIESTGPVKVEATGGAGVSTSGIYGGADSSSPQTNEGYGVNLYSKILSGITDTGELKSPTCIKVNAQYAATVSCNQAYAGSGGGMGLHCYTANSDLSGDVITFSGLVKARGKVKAETYGAGIRFNGGLEAGSDNGLTTGVGFQPYMRGGLTDVAHFHISNKVHLYSYGSISPDQSSTWGLSCFHPYNVHCATDINWDWGGGENLYLGGYVRTPGYVRLSWTNASDDFNYIDNPAGGFNEAWCGGYFAIKPRWTNVNLSNGVRSGTGVYVDVYGKTFAAGYVKANALSWNLDDGIYNINGDVESQAAVAWWGDDSWDARVDISGVMRSKGNISIRTADNVYVYGGLRSNGAVSLDSYDDHLTENYTYRFGEVRSKLSPAITLDDGTWRFDGQLVSQNNISLSVDCYVAGEDYFRGGIKSEGTVSIDTIGNEQFRCEMIYSKLGPNINLDDGTWILGGLTSQGSWNPNLGAWTNFDIWGGITLGGSHSVTFNDYSLGTEGSYVVQSGGKLNVVGNVNFTLPAEPDPGYGGFHIYDGINCNGNVYIDGRGLNKNDLTIDLGLKANGTGVFAGGNITVNVEDTNDRYFLRCNLKNGNGNIVTLRANNDWADDTLDVYGDIWTGTISKPTIHGGSRVYFYGTNTVPGNYVYPVLPTPAASLFDWPGDAAFSLPAAPGNPPCGVNGLHDAPAAPPAPPALPGEPAMTSFGGSYPAFPNMALASSDLPSWMSYTTEVLEGKALIPSKPSEPIWNASLPVTADRYRPDWSTLLPFGPNNRVKMPKPQWDWWRAEAEQDDIDQPATKHYWSGDATGADKVRVPSSCTDEVFFVEGNAEIDSIDWANDGSVGKATIVVYGNGATPDAGLDLGAAGNGQNGDIKVTGSPDWRIFDKKELHLIANDDISLAPTSDSNFNIGENALYGFYAGDSLEIELALFHSILGSGVLRGNLIAGNSVMLKDPANLGGVGVGWYGFEYSRPEIKPEGWMTPFETGSWRELTKANWK